MDSKTFSKLDRLLTYEHRNLRPQPGEPYVELCTVYATTRMHDGTHMYVGTGMWPKVRDTLKACNYLPMLENLNPITDSQVNRFRVNNQVFESMTPRDWQRKAFKIVRNTKRRQIVVPTAAGKTKFVEMVARSMPTARILYTTVGRKLLGQVYPRLKESMGDMVSCVGRSDEDIRSRVLCCTVGTLHKLQECVFDVTFVDEIQQVATPHRVEKAMLIKSHKVFGLSANYNDRADKADIWSEVLFGRPEKLMTYSEAVAFGDIVPLQVRWRNVDCSSVSVPDTRNSTYRDKFAVWRNEDRNADICDVARRHVADGDQVLIIVRTLEHALFLRRELGCDMAYGTPTSDRWSEFEDIGLVKPGEAPKKPAEIELLQERFARGEVKLAIATSVWNEGVDFKHLRVLIRADAGGTAIPSKQIPGRVARKADGKSVGIVYDYRDKFHDAYASRARHREKTYAELKWEQADYSP